MKDTKAAKASFQEFIQKTQQNEENFKKRVKISRDELIQMIDKIQRRIDRNWYITSSSF